LDQLDDLIRRLDVRRPQVLLEVLVVRLNDGQTRDLGVELRKHDQSGQATFALASLFGLGGPDPNATSIAAPSGPGFTGVVLRPGDVSILVRALETVNQGRSLSMPRLLVDNHESGTFDSVLQQPFLATNASDTVATTSFGGTQDAGTAMQVTPHIAEGDQLVLEYTVSLSEFIGESSDPSLPPPRQQNQIASVVTIPDGHAVVLGGLEVETEANATSRVPWLGSLPLFGWLFQSTSTSRSRSRLYVFLRANVLRHPQLLDLKHWSDRARAEAELPEDGPTVAPRVIR
jgi:general secretion pathway protein D